MATSNEYVVLETGQIIKKELLLSSDLYSGLIDIMTNSHDSTKQSKCNRSQYNRYDQGYNHSNELVVIPVPENVDSETMQDYINFIDRDRIIPLVKSSLKACFLLGDINYTEFCVKRFLTYYSQCKHVLDEIGELDKEQLYLLMPKDLWPETLQQSNRMLTNWLHKYYFSIPNWKTVHEAGGTVYLSQNVQFLVDDHVFVYTIYHNESIADSINVVSNVMSPSKVNDYIEDITHNIIGLYDLLDKRNYSVLDSTTQGSQLIPKSTSPIFIVNDISWHYRSNTLEYEIHCKITGRDKFIMYKKQYYDQDHMYTETIIVSAHDIGAYAGLENIYNFTYDEYDDDYVGYIPHPNVRAKIKYYDYYGNKIAVETIFKDGNTILRKVT